MTAREVIGQIKTFPPPERVKVLAFVLPVRAIRWSRFPCLLLIVLRCPTKAKCEAFLRSRDDPRLTLRGRSNRQTGGQQNRPRLAACENFSRCQPDPFIVDLHTADVSFSHDSGPHAGQ